MLTDEQRKQASALQARGWSVAKIAAEVKGPYQEVRYYLLSQNRRLAKELVLDRYAMAERGRQLTLLQQIYADLYERWEAARDSLDPRMPAELRAILADVRALYELNKEALQAASLTGHHHRIPDVDERFVGTGGHPAVAGVEDGHAPA